jgi:hypothetical protein
MGSHARVQIEPGGLPLARALPRGTRIGFPGTSALAPVPAVLLPLGLGPFPLLRHARRSAVPTRWCARSSPFVSLGHVPDPAVHVQTPVVRALPGLAACRPFGFGLDGGFRDAAAPGDLSLLPRPQWLLDGLNGCPHTHRVARVARTGRQPERTSAILRRGQRQHPRREVLPVIA